MGLRSSVCVMSQKNRLVIYVVEESGILSLRNNQASSSVVVAHPIETRHKMLCKYFYNRQVAKSNTTGKGTTENVKPR